MVLSPAPVMPKSFHSPIPVFDAQKAIHLALTMVVGWLGFLLLLPGSTFDTGQSWWLFAKLMSEDYWGIFFVVGYTIGVAGIDTVRVWLRMISIFALSSIHGMVALLFLFSSPLSGGSGTFMIWCFLGYYLVYRQYLLLKA